MKDPIALYEYRLGHHTVWAIFNGALDIVFEGIDHGECVKWCHQNNIRMMGRQRYKDLMNASFHKVNAKTKFNPADYVLAIVK